MFFTLRKFFYELFTEMFTKCSSSMVLLGALFLRVYHAESHFLDHHCTIKTYCNFRKIYFIETELHFYRFTCLSGRLVLLHSKSVSVIHPSLLKCVKKSVKYTTGTLLFHNMNNPTGPVMTVMFPPLV